MNAKVFLEVVDDVVVSYATPGTLADEDLTRIVEACCADSTRKYLSVSVGEIMVTAKQRAEARKLSRVRIAAIIDSAVMRGVVTALSWFGVKIAAFAPDRLEHAIAALEVSPGQRVRILALLASMKAAAAVAA